LKSYIKKMISLVPKNQKPPPNYFCFLKLSNSDLIKGLNKYN